MKLLLRWVISALTLLLITNIVAGVHVEGLYTALIVALIVGLLNAVVRPVLVLLTLPVNMLTLGLFTFVINAAILWFVSTIVKGFTIDGFWPALIAALILWAVSTLTSHFLTKEKNN